jgi:hypothetical protein
MCVCDVCICIKERDEYKLALELLVEASAHGIQMEETSGMSFEAIQQYWLDRAKERLK